MVDSYDNEQFFIDNFFTNMFEISGGKDIIINNGEINAMIIDDYDGKITLQGSSTIGLITYESGNKFQILDCRKYDIASNEKEITFVLDDSNDIRKNKEQHIDAYYDYESIIFDIDTNKSELIFTINCHNKSLKKITLPDATNVTFKMTKEMFDNLETIEGDEDQIEIIE